jgi:hypothetical protein
MKCDKAVCWMISELEFDFQEVQGLRDFFSFTMSGSAQGSTQSPIYSVLLALYTSRIKQSAREAYQSPPSSAKVKNVWSYTSTPYFFMAWCLMKHRNNFIFYLTMLQNCSKCRPVTGMPFQQCCHTLQ